MEQVSDERLSDLLTDAKSSLADAEDAVKRATVHGLDACNLQLLADYHRDCVAALTELLARRESERWVPVGERLPTREDGDKDGNVLCRGRNGDAVVRYHKLVIYGPYKSWCRIPGERPLPSAPAKEVKP